VFATVRTLSGEYITQNTVQKSKINGFLAMRKDMDGKIGENREVQKERV
jgi:hypothetical protein